ncbi:MAG: hypothetical protein IKP46_02010 [Bacteroidales bacterium]|nr:hypothetical protein [Bacteroidales bacterium]
MIEQFLSEFSSSRDRHEVAFLVGNGINRHFCKQTLSWNDLVQDIGNSLAITGKYDSLSPTEHYSAMVLDRSEVAVRSRLSTILSIKQSDRDAFSLINNALKKLDIPVLTTNVDVLLDDGLNLYDIPYGVSQNGNLNNLMRSSMWNLNHYFSSRELTDINRGFGVWHIHGTLSHEETLRFGLIDYGKLIARIDPSLVNIFKNDWELRNTWLQPFMKLKLCIVGVRISSVEIFLRWLLLRKAHIFKDCLGTPNPGGWYLYPQCETEELKDSLQFFRNVGITPVEFPKYKDIYDTVLELK